MLKYQYSNLLIYFMTSVIVSMILVILAKWYTRGYPTRKKLMSYECGFEPFTDARKSFYINFYNIGLVFLLFDVELMLILPGLYSLVNLTSEGLGWLYFFIAILMFGYLYELLTGALKIGGKQDDGQNL